MDMKKIFNKKKKTNKASSSSVQGSSRERSIFDGKSSNIDKNINENLESSNDNKSFQYSYYSNSNSLFSSKRTLSTAGSSQASSNNTSSFNRSSGKKFTSIGRPLQILNEDVQEDGREYDDYNTEDINEVEDINHDEIIKIENNPIEESHNDNFEEDEAVDEKMDYENQELDESSSKVQSSSPILNRFKFTNASHNNSQNKVPSIDLSSIKTSKTAETLNQMNEFIKSQLRNLSYSMTNIMIQISQSVINLTKASIMITECMNSIYRTIKSYKNIDILEWDQFNTINSIGLRRIIKMCLNLIDNLLVGDVYNKSKSLILKHLYDLLKLIKIVPNESHSLTNFITFMSPKVFPIDFNISKLASFDKVDNIMNKILSKEDNSIFEDQEGSFIAPVCRGFFTSSLSVVTFIFGFPKLTKEHQDVIKSFGTKMNEFHFMLQKNKILSGSMNKEQMKFKMPFRTIKDDQEYIPISMSLSSDYANISSGTLGGYLYPKVSNNCMNPKILKYRGNVFGLTCAHVVLNNDRENEDVNKEKDKEDADEDEDDDDDEDNEGIVKSEKKNKNSHPNISIPSSVLINFYKRALVHEMKNHSTKTPEYKVYHDAVSMIDEEFPIRKIRINDKKIVFKNLPKNNFGSIVWGERMINMNRLSDMAIIKISDEVKGKKYINYLGEDLQLSQYDPSLILSNLNIKCTVSLQPRKNGILNNSNLEVFKVGSTTGYTRGKINGMKMIYWSDGSLRSSEFIISNGDGKMEGFANGGDSGAWILSKVSDVNKIRRRYNEIFSDEEGGNNNGDEFGNYNDSSEEDEDYDEEEEDEEEDENTKAYKSSLTSYIESFIPKIRVRKSKQRKNKKKNRRNKGEGNNDNEEYENSIDDDNENDFDNEMGLGVLGMLHSYDGEYKQFGLFTTIDDILDRLENVTGIEWGVVGCNEDKDFDVFSNNSVESKSRTIKSETTSDKDIE